MTQSGFRRLIPSLLAVALIGAVALIVVLLQHPWTGSSAEEAGIRSDDAQPASALVTQIQRLQNASSLDQFVDAAGSTATAHAWATMVWNNRQRLDVNALELRFVSGGESGVDAQGTVQTKADVWWRPGEGSGMAQRQTDTATIALIFDRVADGSYAVRTARQVRGPLPLWLAGAVSVDRIKGATVIAIDHDGAQGQLIGLAAKAYRGVRDVVPGASAEPLVVVAPHSQSQAAAVLGQEDKAISQLAAVTTTVDGSDSPKAPAAIVINPEVFAPMDERAAQVVMTHEATHLMTAAYTADVPAWVLEGFADFVALKRDTAPLAVSAGQILAAVRTGGAPQTLPTRKDFESARHGLGATYESAWMIFRMLGEDNRDTSIVDFYRSTIDGQPVADALDEQFGLSLDELTKQWRRYLVKSVSTSS